MDTFFSWGCRRKAFTYQDVAELIFGKLVVNVDNVDLTAQTGTKFVTWEMHNCEEISKDFRRELLTAIRGDLRNPNYDFVLPRILCALGYQCITKEPANDVKHTLINWTTLFTTITPKVANADILPLREILFWHEDCEMPYTLDEIKLIQQITAYELAQHQEWLDAQAHLHREDIEKGLKLPPDEVTSGMLHYVGRMLEFLLGIRYAADPARQYDNV